MTRRTAKVPDTDTIRVTVRVPRAKAARLREIAAEMRQTERRPRLDRFEGHEIDDETSAMFQEAIERPAEPHPRDLEGAEAFLRNLEDLEPSEIGLHAPGTPS
jgi:hypothetical protein